MMLTWIKRGLVWIGLGLLPVLLTACGIGDQSLLTDKAVLEETAVSDAPEVYSSFAVVADSHNANDNLQKALDRAKEAGVDYVIGLGDYTQVGSIEELPTIKETTMVVVEEKDKARQDETS